MKVPTWGAVVDTDGKAHLDAANGFKAWLKTLANQRVEITVRKQQRKATRKQHGWYRGVALPMIAEEMGHLPYEYPAVHDMLMREWFGLKAGKHPKFKIRQSTADMSTVEFTDQMIEMVQIWAAQELGLVIPDPDPEWKNKRRKAAVAA